MCCISKTGFDQGTVLQNRRTGEYNVSLRASFFKEFSSDEKELDFCITTTTWFWFVSYYWSNSYIFGMFGSLIGVSLYVSQIFRDFFYR